MSKLAKWFRIIVCQWLLSVLMLAITVFGLWNAFDYWRTARWIQIAGTIVSLKITTSEGSEPSSEWSGRGHLTCQYSYTIGGHNYSGNQVGVETFGSRSPRIRRYRQLKAQMDEGTPIVVWVNPTAPTESAIFREILSEMYFGPALGMFWFGMLFIGWRRYLPKHASMFTQQPPPRLCGFI